jgi:hypothetical protein
MIFFQRVFALAIVGLILPLSAEAGIFGVNLCDRGSSSPRPLWVSQAEAFSQPGFKVGVGTAERSGKSVDEQRAAAEADAKKHLVQQLEVRVTASDSHRVAVSQGEVDSAASSEVVVEAEAVLRGLKFKEHWVDPETCIDYTLALVSEESVAAAQHEKTMRGHWLEFKRLFAASQDAKVTPEIQQRRALLDEAQALFLALDFKLLPEQAISQPIVAKQLRDAQVALSKQLTTVSGRVALFAFNQEGALEAPFFEMLLENFKNSGTNRIRLSVSCEDDQACMTMAKAQGFSQLMVLTVSSEGFRTDLGMYKVILRVSKKVYDLESRKSSVEERTSVQMIAMNRSEFNWEFAVKKVVNNLNKGN